MSDEITSYLIILIPNRFYYLKHELHILHIAYFMYCTFKIIFVAIINLWKVKRKLYTICDHQYDICMCAVGLKNY